MQLHAHPDVLPALPAERKQHLRPLPALLRHDLHYLCVAQVPEELHGRAAGDCHTVREELAPRSVGVCSVHERECIVQSILKLSNGYR
ncbi:hypothetical protein A0H81_03842 [Grifola frondosa]|uniref:Uncharacterized protein n=1 Tax=Grifola frondosa TaxID=5627 RepID=A0A1C7MKD7_GRIFR|nr:hypothetical protein A0H81_03842 [Grifola frondosa]